MSIILDWLRKGDYEIGKHLGFLSDSESHEPMITGLEHLIENLLREQKRTNEMLKKLSGNEKRRNHRSEMKNAK